MLLPLTWVSSPPLAGQMQCEFGHLRSVVDNVLLSDGSDVVNWKWTSSGRFSVSSAYSFLIFDGVEDRSTQLFWPLKIPLSIKIFLWLAARNRLLTADQLLRRGWLGPSVCFLCMANAERIDHILFDCPFATSLWILFLSGFPPSSQHLMQGPGDLITCWRRVRATLPANSQICFDVCFTAGCWELWNERNRRIFDGASNSVAGCGHRAATSVQLWSIAFCRQV